MFHPHITVIGGFIGNENDLIKNLNLLINNKKIRIILGSNAQKTIIKKGNKKHFQEAWIKILK